MSSTLHMLRAVLESNISGFARKMKQAADATDGLGKKWLEAGQAVGRSAERITLAVGSAATGIAAAVAKVGISFNAAKESAEVAFTTMLKDGEKAKALMQDLQKFAATTPFQLPEILKASKALLAFGVDVQNLTPTLRQLGDVAAGVGIPFSELAEIYGKAKVQGRLFAEDMNQLTGRGIPIIGEFAKQFGVAESEVRKLVEEGRIGFPHLEEAFRSLTSEGAMFHNMMEAQSQTFTGVLSTLKDNLNMAAGEIMAPAFERIRESMKGFVEALAGPQFKAAIERIGNQVAGLVDRIGGEFANLTPGDVIGRLELAVSGAINLFGQLAQSAVQVGPSLLKFAEAMAAVVGPILEFVAQHPALLKMLALFKVASWMGIASAVSQVGSALLSTATAITGAGAASATAAPQFGLLFGPAGAIALGVGALAVLIYRLKALQDEYDAIQKKADDASKRIADSANQAGQARHEGRMQGFAADSGVSLEELSRRAAEAEKGVKFGQRAVKELEAEIKAGEKAQQRLNKLGDSGVRGDIKAFFGGSDRAKEIDRLRAQVARGNAARESLPGQRAAVGRQAQENRSALDAITKVGTQRVSAPFAGMDAELFSKMRGQGMAEAQQGPKEFARQLQDLRDQAERGLISYADAGKAADAIVEKSKAAAEAYQKAMEPYFAQQKQAAIDSAVAQQAKAEELATKRSELQGFGTFSDMLNTPGLGPQGAKAVVETIPGAGQQEQQDFVAKFQQLQAAGQATKENIDALLENLLRGIQESQQKTQIAKQEIAKQEALVAKQIQPLADKIANSGLEDTQKEGLVQQLEVLAEQYRWGALSADVFRERVKELAKAFNEAAGAANVAGAEVKQNAAGGGGGGFFGGLGSFLNRPLNKIGGDALSWVQDVNSFFTGGVQDAANSFKNTVESTDPRPMIQKIYDALAPSPMPFVGVSGQTASVEGGGGSQNINVSLPNLTRVSNTEISKLASMIQQEMSRRGRPF